MTSSAAKIDASAAPISSYAAPLDGRLIAQSTAHPGLWQVREGAHQSVCAELPGIPPAQLRMLPVSWTTYRACLDRPLLSLGCEIGYSRVPGNVCTGSRWSGHRLSARMLFISQFDFGFVCDALELEERAHLHMSYSFPISSRTDAKPRAHIST